MRFIWFRALMMTISLTFVTIAIRNLNSHGISPQMASVIGIEAPQGPKIYVPGSLNWCETRVEALALSNGTEIRQEGLKWFKSSPSGKEELNPLVMEKWLSKNCTVRTELTQNRNTDMPKKMLTVDFIKGQPQTLMRYPNGEFVWDGQTFKSPQMASALLDLESLTPSTH